VEHGFFGWRLRNVAAAVREDQYAHAPPLGTVRNLCPSCGEPREMTCYRLADGPFGTHEGLHLLCPVCGDGFSVDKADEDAVLGHLVPVGDTPE
jgi:hypothetical protein